jgi:RNA polymerase sigma factor (sigma-70 family)
MTPLTRNFFWCHPLVSSEVMEASALHAPAGAARVRGNASPAFLRLRSDEQLVDLFRAGHEDAFRVIHDRYRARLFAYTRQMLPNSRADAEDALQDVFIRAYAGLRANNRHLALRAWLYRVAHNRCVDQLRKNAPILTEEFETPSRDVSTDPTAAVEQREDLRKLVIDVQRLPDQQRSALLMREMSGMSYQELADSMELSVPAVKSLLVRARTGLCAAAEARDAACETIRAEVVDCHERGARPNALARRHLSDCAACRDYRESVRGLSKSMAALIPAGPMLLGLKLLGIGSVYSAAAYSGSAGGAAAGGVAAGGAAVGGATAGGAAAGGAALSGAGAAASGGAVSGVAAGGAAVGGAAAGSALAGGVSAAHVAAIIAAAAAAGGAVAVTHQSAPAHHFVPVYPAAAVITRAVDNGISHGSSPAAVVATVKPLDPSATVSAPAANTATTLLQLRHTGATTGASHTTTPAAATTTAPASLTPATATTAHPTVSTPVTPVTAVTTPAATTSTAAAPVGAVGTSTVISPAPDPGTGASATTAGDSGVAGVAALGTTTTPAAAATTSAANLTATTTPSSDPTATTAAPSTTPGAATSAGTTTPGAATSAGTSSPTADPNAATPSGTPTGSSSAGAGSQPAS